MRDRPISLESLHASQAGTRTDRAFPAPGRRSAGRGAQSVEKPATLVADGTPEAPPEVAARTRPYMKFRTATFLGWNPADRSMLIATCFDNTSQAIAWLIRAARALGSALGKIATDVWVRETRVAC